jgi:hypothetical protein
MSMRHYRTIVFLVGASLATILAGCNDPEAVDLRSRHQDSLGWALGSMGKVEAGTQSSMAWAVSQFRGQNERDLENTSKNPARLGAMMQNDIDRWKANQPVYNEVIQRELGGKPDNIARTAPKMIW